ncbi:MAG: hypothetical protein F6K36_28445 [Symploca sp. SIO3C6]|nr:hypothetical protein [Symploca sp. SIO3C6]
MEIKLTPKYVRFLKWNGVIYNLDHKAPKGVSPALKSSRYKGDSKSIIDAAINDLRAQENGSWLFSGEKGWQKMPLSVPEIEGIAEYDHSVLSQLGLATPTRPLFPSDLPAYHQELKEFTQW